MIREDLRVGGFERGGPHGTVVEEDGKHSFFIQLVHFLETFGGAVGGERDADVGFAVVAFALLPEECRHHGFVVALHHTLVGIDELAPGDVSKVGGWTVIYCIAHFDFWDFPLFEADRFRFAVPALKQLCDVVHLERRHRAENLISDASHGFHCIFGSVAEQYRACDDELPPAHFGKVFRYRVVAAFGVGGDGDGMHGIIVL